MRSHLPNRSAALSRSPPPKHAPPPTSAERNKLAVVEAGGVEALLPLLESDAEALRNRASLCLCTLTQTYAVRLKLKGEPVANMIAKLMPLLAPSASSVSHENARCGGDARQRSPRAILARKQRPRGVLSPLISPPPLSGTLANLAAEYTPRQAIYESQALPKLVPLLAAQDPAVVRNSIKCISALLEDYQARAAIAGLNGVCSGLPAASALPRSPCFFLTDVAAPSPAIEPITNLLGSEYNELQQAALQVISKCARNQETRFALCTLGGRLVVVHARALSASS